MREVIDWLDERTGSARCARAALDEKIPGGARAATCSAAC